MIIPRILQLFCVELIVSFYDTEYNTNYEIHSCNV